MTDGQQLEHKVRRLDEIVRGTEQAPGLSARLHNAEERLRRIENNEQTIKQWDRDLGRLWVFVVVSIFTGSIALITAVVKLVWG